MSRTLVSVFILLLVFHSIGMFHLNILGGISFVPSNKENGYRETSNFEIMFGEYSEAIMAFGIPTEVNMFKAGDYEGDGKPEIAVYYLLKIMIIGDYGVEEELSCSYRPSTGIAVGSVDGHRIVFFGSGPKFVVVIDGEIHTYSLQSDAVDIEFIHGRPYIASTSRILYLDISSYSLVEFYHGDSISALSRVEDFLLVVENSRIVALRETGDIAWSVNFVDSLTPIPSDVDNDGVEEIAVANRTVVGIIDEGSLVVYYQGSWSATSISVGNMVRDAKKEIYLRLSDGDLIRVTPGTYEQILNGVNTRVEFFDFDGDGYDEALMVKDNYYSKLYPNGTIIQMFPKALDIVSESAYMVDFDVDSIPEYILVAQYWGENKVAIMKHFREATIPLLNPSAKAKVRYDASKYHTCAEIYDILSQLASEYPDRVEIFSIGRSYDVDGEKKLDIYAVKITNGDRTEKPSLMIIGAHHARELITAEAALYLIVNLTEQYGFDPVITDILNNFDVYVVPILNVGGHDYALQFDWLRRNLHPVDEDRDGEADEDPPEDINGDGLIDAIYKYTAYGYVFWGYEGYDDDGDGRPSEDPPGGVDLNRNYNYSWTSSGEYSNPASDIYSGTAPLSEPESRALSKLMRETLPLVALSLHSGEESIFYPWGMGYRVIPEKDRIETLSSILQSVTGFAAMQSAAIYEAYGVWDDYAYGYLGTIPLTPEIFRNESGMIWEFYEENGETYYRLRGCKWLFNPREPYIKDVSIKVLKMFVATALWAKELVPDSRRPSVDIYAKTSGSKVKFVVNATDDNSGIQTVIIRRLDGGKDVYVPRNSKTGLWEILRDRGGTYRITVRDRSGKIVEYYSDGKFEFVYPRNDTGTNQSSIRIIWSAPYNTKVMKYEVYVNNELIITTMSGETVAEHEFSSQGTYIIRVVMYTDTDTQEIISMLTYDVEPPTVRITSPANGSTLNTSKVTITWEATDNIALSVFRIYINETQTSETKENSIELTFSKNGTYIITVEALDKANNTARSSIIIGIAIPKTRRPQEYWLPILATIIIAIIYIKKRR